MSVLERNNVKVSGRARSPMVFAHGFGCDQNMWRFVAPAFEDDYRVVLFDHVGAGQLRPLGLRPRPSTARCRATPTTCWRSARELELQRRRLRRPLGQRDDRRAGGHHGAGALRALVLVGPSPRYVDDGDYVGGFSREDIEELLESLDSNYLGWSSRHGARRSWATRTARSSARS